MVIHKRIIKNSFYLYFRMLITLIVSLYTSRVVLDALGINDFGIYNVVGGVVTLFSFISGAMTSATQRYFSFELGKKNEKKLNDIFKMSLNVYLIFYVVLCIFLEIVGNWFISEKLNIDSSRLEAAYFVFQCSLLVFAFNVFRIPYMSCIIAYEKMSAFAYMGFFEILMKLAIAFVLMFDFLDKLKIYSILSVIVSVLSFIFYYIYCKRNFFIAKYEPFWDFLIFKDLFSYTGWSLFGNLSVVLANQGVNILINVFFGSSINAARAIALQINNSVVGFVSGFQMALNPQIIKTYAEDKRDEMEGLIMSGAKYSFFLLFAISFPIMLKMDFILSFWLKIVPEYTSEFSRLVLIDALLASLSGTLITAVQATGNIRKYQIIVGSILLLNMPISYLLMSIWNHPASVFWISISITVLALSARLMMLKSLLNISIKKFFLEVLFKVASVVVIVVFFSELWIKTENTVNGFVFSSFFSCFTIILCILLFGTNSKEKRYLSDFSHKLFKRS